MHNAPLQRESKRYFYVAMTVRLLLLLAIVLNVGFAYFYASDKSLEIVFWALLTLILSFLPEYFEKRRGIYLPIPLEVAIVVFVFAALFLSAQFNLYDRVFWWDDLLHWLAGIIIGFLGLMMIYILNKRYKLEMTPLFVAIFAFTFAATLGVIWEILEFSLDYFLGTNSQSWDAPNGTMLLGNSYQGAGLRDTMSDLIIDLAGAAITSIISFFLFRDGEKDLVSMMRRVWPQGHHLS